MNVADGGVLSLRDEGPTKGDMFGPVVEAILFREGNGRGAILIEGSGSCLSETQFVCKLEQIDVSCVAAERAITSLERARILTGTDTGG